MLESVDELDCSMLLASHLHYKQAMQVLRNFLEGVVLQLYFCENEAAFAAWKDSQFKVPSFRGRGGMMENLLSRGVVSQELAGTVSILYGELNGTIHGAETRLNNRGIFTGNWSGRLFSATRFEEWCRYFSRCVSLAIPIMRLHINIWNKACSADPTSIRCSICHSANDFDVEKTDFAGEALSTMRCRRCGHSMTMSTESLEKRGLG